MAKTGARQGRPLRDASGEQLGETLHLRVSADDKALLADIARRSFGNNLSVAMRSVLRMGILSWHANVRYLNGQDDGPT